VQGGQCQTSHQLGASRVPEPPRLPPATQPPEPAAGLASHPGHTGGSNCAAGSGCWETARCLKELGVPALPLTSLRLLAVCIGLAIGIPVALGILWRRGPRTATWALPLVLASVLAAQGSAMAAVAVQVNRVYGTYPSWSSLFGTPVAPPVLSGSRRVFPPGVVGLRLRHRALPADPAHGPKVRHLTDGDHLAAASVPRSPLRQDSFSRGDGARRRPGTHLICRPETRLCQDRQRGDPQRPGSTLRRRVPRDQRGTSRGDRVH